MPESPTKVLVHTPQGLSGILQRDGSYLFSFAPDATPESAPALGMPLRARPYEFPSLHPIFQMNMPEGFVLEQLRNRLAKTTGLDPLLLLTVIGSQAPIGRLRFTLEGQAGNEAPVRGESLAELLAHGGSRELFARLVDSYLMRTGLSGVQPKVLVPERVSDDMRPTPKASLPTSELIVKSGLGEFPGLAINEFICMSIVKQAGVPVPEFHLSDDGELFVMRRFDRPPDGRILGFEDMLALAGRAADQKYVGSYELVLRLLHLYCSPEQLPAAREQLFDMVVLSCILGNGDAHMKNFGVLYDSLSGAVRMAPAYDIVCTRLYIADDNLALNLEGNRSFFAARLGLLDFGLRCDMPKARIIERTIQLCELTFATLASLDRVARRLPGLRELIAQQTQTWLDTFKRLQQA
jgi:serine/threonine-protein kinase HipA